MLINERRQSGHSEAEKIARIQKNMLSTFDRSQAISQPNPDAKYRYQ
ncbi:hypothetical protein AI2945V1_2986 [Klebsiella oxytoca]|nr:hypothetical protein AI2945V1_2986 [Klebsiella oxytoca]CAF2889988.1 hypothetical protein AI2946V1_2985 [Klebsiella oxytoca]CAH5628997.1 hypothetical protein AI2946V1_2985 [Klebsiella oxytoca]CAH5670202.1 hypothetical protein AI2945V1_2986 [Klebsiella oxytoca]SQI91172.1 Uncharacterised protein [Klebsiella oxytoca]